MGKMRVDELQHYFESLMPHKSKAHEKFYADAWCPPEGAKAAEVQGPSASSEKVTLATNNASDPMC
jgi:hypothetical protein